VWSCILRIVSGLVFLEEIYCSLSRACLLTRDWGMSKDESSRWFICKIVVVEYGLSGGSVDVEGSPDTLTDPRPMQGLRPSDASISVERENLKAKVC
jgi:hypothetical protein